MSARLNFNPIRYFPWKGKTFSQITTTIQKNKSVNNPTITNNNLFRAAPLKIYRREISNTTVKSCNPRTSVRIDELNSPNGYLVYSNNNNNSNGLANTLDINLTSNTYDLGKSSCNTSTNCFNQAKNALRRVRSSGMIKPKPDPTHNNVKYFTGTQQYLISRNRSFQQNQFQYSSTRPTTTQAYCNPVYKPSNSKFAQQGGVSSSARTLRKDFDTITTIGGSYRTSYGSGMANSLAYGVPNTGYNTTLKDKIGYPLKRTPIISKYSDKIICKTASNIRCGN